MACNVNISNPMSGQNVSMPLNWDGFAMGSLSPGGGQANIIAASWQLDDGQLTPLSITAGPSVMLQGTIDGLAADSNHMLTLYAWDDQSVGSTSASANFHVLAPPPP